MTAGLLALPLIALAEWRRSELLRLARWLNLARLPVLVERQILKAASWGPYLAIREALRPHLPYLGGLALLTLLASLPLLQFKVMSGHDALVYLPRAVEFYRGLSAWQLFPRWAPDLSAGYGQPLFNFTPPFFYYLSAFFHVLGFIILISYLRVFYSVPHLCQTQNASPVPLAGHPICILSVQRYNFLHWPVFSSSRGAKT